MLARAARAAAGQAIHSDGRGHLTSYEPCAVRRLLVLAGHLAARSAPKRLHVARDAHDDARDALARVRAAPLRAPDERRHERRHERRSLAHARFAVHGRRPHGWRPPGRWVCGSLASRGRYAARRRRTLGLAQLDGRWRLWTQRPLGICFVCSSRRASCEEAADSQEDCMRLMGWHMSVGTDPCMRVACACSEFTKCSWKCSRNRMTMFM